MEESRINTSKRIFIGFSSEDRYEVVESILYHLANYGMALWYDRHKMRLGDICEDNFLDGIEKTEYAVLIFTKKTNQSKFFANEMQYIKKQYDNKKIAIFPLLYKIDPNELHEDFQWVTRLIYKTLDEKSGGLLVCNHIMSRILTDELQKCKYQTLHDLQENIAFSKKDIFIEKMLQSYLDIDRNNHNARVAVLFSVFTYLFTKYDTVEMLPQHYWRGFNRIFSYTKLHLEIDQREILILEMELMILINKLDFGCN